ncbi:MAG: hypothetical protein LUQ36_01100, partial [Methanoregula sp.]|nr:hypothetical protein [Methanoregula sp.]
WKPGVVGSTAGDSGKLSGPEMFDPGGERRGWPGGPDSVPLTMRNNKQHSVTTEENAKIFLKRRRRLFVSICCLYRSGRYTGPVSIGFLFTTADLLIFSIVWFLSVKK